MKLFNAFSERGYHTTIITTFGVDFQAYERVALSQLRKADCNNNILLADARMLAMALEDEFRRPGLAGRAYTVVGAQTRNGVFHPKLMLQLGQTRGRLLVASANMTAPGLAGNLEVVGEVRVADGDPTNIPILRAALEYLAPFVEATNIPRRQIEWAMERTRWLANSEPSAPPAQVRDDRILEFLSSRNSGGIANRFIELVAGRSVKRLIAISPYWDADLGALRRLHQDLSPKSTAVVIQPDSELFPVQRWPFAARSDLYNLQAVRVAGVSRFAHAKVLIAETATADCVLFGSANCTTAALGDDGGAASNEEACLYRELEPGRAVALLDLELALSRDGVLTLAEVKAFKPSGPIPLKGLTNRLPGRFELSASLLQWWPPRSLEPNDVSLDLMDKTGATIATSVRRVGTSALPVLYEYSEKEIPFFVRVRREGFESSLAVVMVEQAIQETWRASKSTPVKNALEFLDDDEAFEGLWILQVIQSLENVERKEGAGGHAASANPTRGGGGETPEMRATYDDFVRGRQSLEHRASGGSLLAASHQESVRSFLNALLGMSTSRSLVDELDEPEAPRGTGDETANPEEALNEDDRFQSDQMVAPVNVETDAKMVRRRQQYMKDTQQSLVRAVEHFIDLCSTTAKERFLGPVELLRLRVLLLVVLASGSAKVQLFNRQVDAAAVKRELLPISGEGSWRRLVGRLLFSFFSEPGGALISRVALELRDGEGLPGDILECWATCYWALCATRVAVNDRCTPVALSPSDERLAKSAYRYLKLLPERAIGQTIWDVFRGMSNRYGTRLGVVETALMDEHERLLAEQARADVAGASGNGSIAPS